MAQRYIRVEPPYGGLDDLLREEGEKTLFLVCDEALRFLRLKAYFDTLETRLGIRVVTFSDFAPNPAYESVVKGVAAFREAGTRLILAVGGGSAMDVAKCIKLYADMDPERNYLEQEIRPNDVRLMALPTTAGTGSEATRFAVIYYKGEKQSVAHESCIPATVLFAPDTLETLPAYQRKSTLLDALSHAVESFWSVNSTPESRDFAREAIGMILEHRPAYLANEPGGNEGMLRAANLAGRAINITQTTAGHAMCYKLTSLYRLAHGHAAALCNKALFPWLAAHPERCIDPRGEAYLRRTMEELAAALGCASAEEAAARFGQLVDSLALPAPAAKAEDLPVLCRGVNPVRLKNFPARLEGEDIEALYQQILFGVREA